jgi:hypothetical protein
MSPELIAALYGVGGTIIGALIGAGISIRLNQQQLSASFKKQKLDLLHSQIARLQAALNQVQEPTADVNAPNLTSEQIRSKLTDMFLKRAGLFLTFSYLFPQELEDEVTSVRSMVNQFIYQAKIGNKIDENHSKQCVKKMQLLDHEILAMIRKKLRAMNSEFERLTSDER